MAAVRIGFPDWSVRQPLHIPMNYFFQLSVQPMKRRRLLFGIARVAQWAQYLAVGSTIKL